MSWNSKATLGVLAALGVGLVGGVSLAKALYWLRARRKGTSTAARLQHRPKRDATRQLTLYHKYPFRSSRAAWLIAELGAEEYVEVKPISLHGQDAKDLMAYRDVHPHGTLPALALEDGTILLESSAICLYLAEVFLGPEGEALLPPAESVGEYYNFICYATSTFDHILEPLYMQLTHTPEDKRNNTLVDSMMRKFAICANVISNLLSDRTFICGDKFTTADCVLGYNIWWASVIQGGVLLEDYPVLKEYLQRLMARESFKKTFQGQRQVKPSGGSL